MTDIYKVLDDLGICYDRHDHPPVFTCEEADELTSHLPGLATKNLFLRNKKGDRHYLVVVSHEKRVDLKGLRELLGESKLSFGSPERLLERLGLTPGSVSILGIANDPNQDVDVIIDQMVWDADQINCHPNINTASLAIAHDDLAKFVQHFNPDFRVFDVPAF